ncbi:MAG: hypothetical protein ACYDDS_06485 [Candidatus Sulfotelmatobacter sp.]
MSHAAGEATTEGKADDRRSGLWAKTFPGQFPSEGLHGPDDLAKTLHRNPTFLSTFRERLRTATI